MQEESYKQILLKQLLYKVVAEQRLDTDFKIFLKYPNFLGSVYNFCFHTLRNNVNEGKGVSTDYLAEHHSIIPVETDKRQHEIIDQLRSLFEEEELNKAISDYQKNVREGKLDAYHTMRKKIDDIELAMAKVQAVSQFDDEELDKIHKSICEGDSYLNFGDNKSERKDSAAWNALEVSKGQVVSVLSPTKHGKSFLLENIHAMLALNNYKVVHASYEMPRKDFYPRFYSQLMWYPLNSFKHIDYSVLTGFKHKMQNMFKTQTIQTQEDGRGDLVKVEKLLETYRPDALVLDYLFNLNESFDPVTTKVVRDLKTLAVMYNCAIFTALNTNDEGRKTDEPPEITHIKWCKTIADDFDKIISMFSRPDKANPLLRRTEFISKLIRQDKWVNWRVREDRNLGLWKLRDLYVNGVCEYVESYSSEVEEENVTDYEVA